MDKESRDAERRGYLKENVDSILQELILKLVKERPENVMKFINEWSTRNLEGSEKPIEKISEEMRKSMPHMVYPEEEPINKEQVEALDANDAEGKSVLTPRAVESRQEIRFEPPVNDEPPKDPISQEFEEVVATNETEIIAGKRQSVVIDVQEDMKIEGNQVVVDSLDKEELAVLKNDSVEISKKSISIPKQQVENEVIIEIEEKVEEVFVKNDCEENTVKSAVNDVQDAEKAEIIEVLK